MSAHVCPVVKLGRPNDIPGADKIVVFNIEGSGPVVSSRGQFNEGDLATFIPPETMVNTQLETFSFLSSKARKSDKWAKIRPVRLRRQLSVGILVPPVGSEGSNGAEAYFVKKIEDLEPVKMETSKKKIGFFKKLWLKVTGKYQEENKKPWPGLPVYDINQLYKMPKDLFADDELMMVTEKLHGTNARYVIGKDGKLFCGSRTMWRVTDTTNVYGRIGIEKEFERKLKRLAEPIVLWGEIIGPQIQKGFSYNLNDGDLDFRCFDMYNAIDRRFLDPDETKNICHWLKIEYVPIVAIDHWKNVKDHLQSFAATRSWFTDKHPREGVVVRPWKDVKETHALDGSKCLVAGKVINPAYLEFKEKPGTDEQIML